MSIYMLCAPPVEGEDVREFHPGLLFVHPAGLTARDRARAIHVEHEMGRTYAEIGPDVGLSYQRARQLSRRYRRAA